MTEAGTTTQAYVGTELELFQHARNWKRYLARQLRPFLGRRVLEVGAGLGGTTALLAHAEIAEWVCLEPDPRLVDQLREKITRGELPRCCRAVTGMVGDLDPAARFDAIAYVDVLEHIADDRGELARAAQHLADGGRLVVLSPAHQWLFSPFDAAIGHHRRYSKATLRAVAPAALEPVVLRYLDSAGVMASAANRFLMKQSLPNPRQLRFWDRFLVPISTIGDRLTGFTLGKSILGVWRRRG